MFTEVGAATILGVEAHRVAVEADVSDGLPSFSIVGYVTAQVREAGDRVRDCRKKYRSVPATQEDHYQSGTCRYPKGRSPI